MPSKRQPKPGRRTTCSSPSRPRLPPLFRKGLGPLLGPETAVVTAQNGVPWWYFYKHGGPFDGRRLASVDPGDAAMDQHRARAGDRLGGL